MNGQQFEEENMGILQNIEFSIHRVYVANPSLTDSHVDSALEALVRTYLGEAIGRSPIRPRNPLSEEVYDHVHTICEVRLGRFVDGIDSKNNNPLQLEPVPMETMLKALKRIRKSVATWTKEGGRQGYLNYISQFMVNENNQH